MHTGQLVNADEMDLSDSWHVEERGKAETHRKDRQVIFEHEQ